MEQKKLYQVIAERLAADPASRERVLNANEDGLMVMMKEHGISDVSKEEAAKLQNALRSAFDQNGALDDAALENVAGGDLLMEQKQLFQVMAERLAADPDLQERVLNANGDGLTAMIVEQGITQIPKE